MELRELRASDVAGVRAVARESMHESYDFVGESTVDDLVERWYADDRVGEESADGTALWLVAEDDGDIAGFVQGGLLDTEPLAGELDWLHVAPAARGEGLGRQLLGRAQETFEKRDAGLLRGLVLAANETGVAFYEAQGFERVDEREAVIGEERYTEYVYETPLDRTGGTDESAETAVVETVPGPAGELFVSYSDGERGTEAPFYPAYRDREFDERHGWYCSNCESTATAMDSSGRIACENCDNARAATRWDNSYL